MHLMKPLLRVTRRADAVYIEEGDEPAPIQTPVRAKKTVAAKKTAKKKPALKKKSKKKAAKK